MNLGFFIILLAQFLSALADNALLFSAIALIQAKSAPPEYIPFLQEFFVVSYIVLAPFVGAFADALPKGQVMFISNFIKIIGCTLMLLGLNPLLAYALVGLGAAAYSPAKYGILSEYLPAELLVVANGWMEGLTVLAIIFGAVLGGWSLKPHFTFYETFTHSYLGTWLSWSQSQFSIALLLVVYSSAALVNLLIPKTERDHYHQSKNPKVLFIEFVLAFKQLWTDPLGRISLAVTTLFWGMGANLRLLVLVWGTLQMHLNMEQATELTAVSAFGIALGAIAAAKWINLENAVRVLPLGVAMGLSIFGMIFIHHWPWAVVLLVISGAMGGFFVVPMNALLQHRGHQLMGAGHSIAVQNFNENISILIMLGIYSQIIRLDGPLKRWSHLPLLASQASFYLSVIFLGTLIAIVMGYLSLRFRRR
jgi:MFS family permease